MHIDDKNQIWSADDISDEASLKDRDEIKREILRGDESEGNPDDRDAAGAVSSNETPHGREEAKNDEGGAENTND